MKKVLRLRLLSVMLVMVLIAQVLSVAAFASGNEETVSEPTNVTETPEETTQEQPEYETVLPQMTPSMGLKAGDKTLEELSLMTVDLATLPELIDPAVALEKGHVNRLHLQETSSNTVMYQNKNGTKTTYLFANPVKYIDGNGNIKDKSSAVSAVLDDTYSYAMQSNSVKAYFPKTSSQNTLVTYGTYGIGMTPKDTAASPASYDANSKKIVYPYAFGENTLLVYTTQLDGLKEDIVLVKNIGVNEFVFDMTLSGLTPYFESGIWYLKNSQNETIGNFGKILINDSAGNMAVGEMSVTQIGGNGKYEVKITAPEEFLNSEDTVYPVYIDPTVRIYEDGFYTYTDEYGEPVYVDYTAIVDIGLYESEYDATYFSEQNYYHCLGQAFGGEGRIIYRLYDFYGEYGQYKDIYAYQIGSAELHLYPYDDYCYSEDGVIDFYIHANPMEGYGEDDNAQTICSSEMLQAYSDNYESITSANIYSSAITIDITEIVRGWARYNSGGSEELYDNPENGFVLRGDASLGYYVNSLERSYVSSPYVVLDISDFVGVYSVSNVESGKYLVCFPGDGDRIVMASNTFSDLGKWVFEYLGDNKYYIRSEYAAQKYLTIGSLSNVAVKDKPDGYDSKYVWIVNFSNYGGITMKNEWLNQRLTFHGSTVYNLDFFTSSTDSTHNSWRVVLYSEYIVLQDIEVTIPDWMDINEGHTIQISTIPENATFSTQACFDFISSDPTVATISNSGTIEGVGDGTTIITVRHKVNTNISYSFPLTVGQIVPDGIYYLMNKQSQLYAGLETKTLSESIPIKQLNLMDKNSDNGQWNIEYLGNGYYSIANCYSDRYLGAYSNGGYPITQGQTLTSASRWRILKTLSGAYKIISEGYINDNYALAVANSNLGTICNNSLYTTDQNYFDEWYALPTDQRINVDVFMDEGYVKRYTESGAVNRINSILSKVRDFYANTFGICVDFSSIQQIKSLADGCGLLYNQDCDDFDSVNCGCENIEGGHHKDVDNILTAFMDLPYTTDQHAKMLFSGHVTCGTVKDNQQEIHKIEAYTGAAYKVGGAVVIADRQDNGNSIMYEISTTIHELGHLFDAPDHYYEGETEQLNSALGEDLFDYDCIYGKNKKKITEELMICEGCKQRIINNADTYLH